MQHSKNVKNRELISCRNRGKWDNSTTFKISYVRVVYIRGIYDLCLIVIKIPMGSWYS